MAPQPFPEPQNSPPQRPSETNAPQHTSHSPWGWVILGIMLAFVLAGAAWIVYARLRAKRLGIAPPRLNPFSDAHRVPDGGYPGHSQGGFIGWAQDKWSSFRNKRTAGGAYEGTSLGSTGPARSGTRGGRRNFGPLDPDEAWDARVGHENDTYYEEQELGLHEPASGPGGAYGGSGYGRRGYALPGRLGELQTGVADADHDDRGRRRSRNELDERYREELNGATDGAPRDNPFADEHAEVSLRGVSPRPHIETEDTEYHGGQGPQHQRNKSSIMNSPTERRSLFREDV